MGFRLSPATMILFLQSTHSHLWAFVFAVPAAWNVLPTALGTSGASCTCRPARSIRVKVTTPSPPPACPISHSLTPHPVISSMILKPSKITLFIACLLSQNVNPRTVRILPVLFTVQMLSVAMLYCLCTRTLTGFVFAKVKKKYQKQPKCPATEEWQCKAWSPHTEECGSSC